MQVISRIVLFVFLVFELTVSAAAQNNYTPIQTQPGDLQVIESGTVKEIVKPDLFLLENNSLYRLDGVRIPADYRAQAKDFLTTHILGQEVTVLANPQQPKEGQRDRNGARYAHVLTKEGKWLQAELISNGLAWAFGSEYNRDLIRPLQALENTSRLAKKGFWALPEFTVLSEKTAKNKTYSFQIVEGIAERVTCGDKQKTCYINFDPDYKTDMTVSIDKKLLDTYTGDDAFMKDLQILTQKPFRVRGWIEPRNGPNITLQFPEQIELLTAPSN